MLPKIDTPIFNTELPVTKQAVRYRPYTVKEQKLLLMATESEDKNSLIDTILQIVNNCTLSKIDVSKLPIVDIEFLFYQLRARSQSEIVELKYRCENSSDGIVCNNIMKHNLNLLTDLEISEGVSDTIQLTDTIGIKLKHQRFEKNNINNSSLLNPIQLFELIAKHVDFIFDKESIYSSNDIPLDKIVEFLETLSTEQYKKIEEFFIKEPVIKKKIDLTCSKCKFEHKIEVENIFDFFI